MNNLDSILKSSFFMFDDFDRCFKRNDKYPPYNIISESDDKFILEIAVAGHSKEDLTVMLDKNKLKIKSIRKHELESKYVHKGISTRGFELEFLLNKYAMVKDENIKLENGILSIVIEKEIPEEEKPKVLKIG